MIIIVDWQAKQGSLGSGQNLTGLNVLKGTPGKNVATFLHVQVTNDYIIAYIFLHSYEISNFCI